MGNTQKSSSVEQMYAESEIFSIVEEKLNLTLERNPKLYLSNDNQIHIEPDFYSEKDLIIGEIFAHIGKSRKAQSNKIANDILKMLLLDKITGKKHRKIIVVCDETELKQLRGKSALSESIRQFEVELLYIPISTDLRNKILGAQKRQRMTNI